MLSNSVQYTIVLPPLARTQPLKALFARASPQKQHYRRKQRLIAQEKECFKATAINNQKSTKMNRILMVMVLETFLVFILFEETDGFLVQRRSAASERNSDDYPDYQLGVKYDEYPMVVPKKRTALLVDRLMAALQKELEGNRLDDLSPEEVRKMDLQRRGHGGMSGQPKGRIYWRCYFNAVTCF